MESVSDKIGINPKFDLTFKALFATSKNEKIMIHFLNGILDLPFKITNIEYINTESVPDTADNSFESNMQKMKKRNKGKRRRDEEILGKLSRMDVLVKTIEKKDKYEEDGDESKIILKAKTDNNLIINVEIQMRPKGNMFKRSFYYASSVVHQSLPTGSSYDELHLIMINLLDYNMFEDPEKRH